MSTVDRSKFKATSVAVAKQADKDLASTMGKGGGKGADYHKITEGTHYYRIYPPHPGEGELYAVPKGVHWLPQVVTEFKDNQPVKDSNGKPKTKIINKPIFNAKIHGDPKKRDIVEEYIAFAERLAKEMFPDDVKDKDNRKDFLEPIYGGFDSQYDGIMINQSWVAYADELFIDQEKLEVKSKILGRLEINKAIKFRINALAAVEAANQPMGTDPFTDLDDGKAISVTYNKAQTPQLKYATEFYAPGIPKSGGMIKLFPISDDDLKKFMEFPSLQKMFVGVYDHKQFKLAKDGLKLFDDQYELGIFGKEEFLDILNTLESEYPASGEAAAATAGAEEEEEQNGGDEFDNMDRDELKEYNRDNKLGIIVSKALTDDGFRQSIREAVAAKGGDDLPFKVDEEEEEQEEVKEEKVEKVVKAEKVAVAKTEKVVAGAKKESFKDRMERIKKK